MYLRVFEVFCNDIFGIEFSLTLFTSDANKDAADRSNGVNNLGFQFLYNELTKDTVDSMIPWIITFCMAQLRLEVRLRIFIALVIQKQKNPQKRNPIIIMKKITAIIPERPTDFP